RQCAPTYDRHWFSMNMISKPRAIPALLCALLLLIACGSLILVTTERGRQALQTFPAPFLSTPYPIASPTTGLAANTATATRTALPTTAITTTTGDVQPSLPLRAAFYYPWFPEAWSQQGINPYTKYLPVLGYCNSAD